MDTERDGHRISFNEAFARKGLKHEWDVDLYGHLLEIGGGKERMYKYFKDHESVDPFKTITDEAERKKFLQELHLLKTDLFMDLIETGRLPLRPGVKALIGACIYPSLSTYCISYVYFTSCDCVYVNTCVNILSQFCCR